MLLPVFGLLFFLEALAFEALLVLGALGLAGFFPDDALEPFVLAGLDGVVPLAGEAGGWAAEVSAAGVVAAGAGVVALVLGVLGALVLGVLAGLALGVLGLLADFPLDLLAF